MSNVKSVMIVGVGGQGTLLASRVLGSAMLSQGVDVKVFRGARHEPARWVRGDVCALWR